MGSASTSLDFLKSLFGDWVSGSRNRWNNDRDLWRIGKTDRDDDDKDEKGQNDKGHDPRPPANPLLGSADLSLTPPAPGESQSEQLQSEITDSVLINGKQFLISSGGGSTVQVTEVTDPAAPGGTGRTSLGRFDSQSVATFGNLVAVALSPSDYGDTAKRGRVRFYRLQDDGSLRFIEDVKVGYLPDSIAFNDKGTKLVIANEGEPNADYSIDRLGSIGIIDIKGKAGKEDFRYTNLSFNGLKLPDGIRISGPAGTTQAKDIEPEYVSILGNYAYVTLQENNGVAKVNLKQNQIEKIFALGTVDFSQQLVDLTDKDDGFKPTLGNAYLGLRMPDAIAAFQVNGKKYFITANEGDGREYGDYTDEVRNPRIKTIADAPVPTTFGSRSASIFDANTGALVWDSGNSLQTIAVAAGVYDDGRSDDKGVEPEGVVVAELKGRTYAIVGSERTTSSLLTIFDVTDPAATTFVTSAVIEGSLSPEGLKVIDAKKSTSGRAELVVSNEVSNTLNIFDLEALIAAPPLAGAGTFTPTMLKDIPGGSELKVSTLITNGEFTNGLEPGSSVFSPTGIFDGMGAYANGDGTYTLLVNSELGATVGYPYTAEGLDATVTGARISKFIVDIDADDNRKNGFQSRIISGGLAYDKVISSDTNGFDRFCSASLVEANSFGAGRGFADRIFLTGEETSAGDGGRAYALDTNTDDLHEVEAFGRAAYENVILVDTGSKNTVAALLFDDTDAPLYLWVGKKTSGGFLERNGLAAENGSLYAWKPPATLPDANGNGKADTADLNALDLSTPLAGSWELLGNGSEVATRSASELRSLALSKGAIELVRFEDGSSNPLDGQQVAFNTTGGRNDDNYGNVYTIDLSSSFKANGQLAATGGATLKVIYDGDRNADPLSGIRSPDNIDWSGDGFLYVQEDRSFAFGTQEASIWKLDPTSADPLTGQSRSARWAQIDRSAVPTAYGQSDPVPTDVGNWESSGIIDVSSIYGADPGSFFLANVQAHSLLDGNLNGAGYLVEGGQINLIQQQTSGLI